VARRCVDANGRGLSCPRTLGKCKSGLRHQRKDRNRCDEDSSGGFPLSHFPIHPCQCSHLRTSLRRTSRFATAKQEAAPQKKFHCVKRTKPRSQLLSRGIIAFTLLMALGRTTQNSAGNPPKKSDLCGGLFARLPGARMESRCKQYYAFCEVQAGHGVGASARRRASYLSAKYLIRAFVGFAEHDGALVPRRESTTASMPGKRIKDREVSVSMSENLLRGRVVMFIFVGISSCGLNSVLILTH
jgi:hypothetical protein